MVTLEEMSEEIDNLSRIHPLRTKNFMAIYSIVDQCGSQWQISGLTDQTITVPAEPQC